MNAARGRHILMQRTARAAPLPRRAAFVLTAALVTALAACSGGGSVNIANSQLIDPATDPDPLTVNDVSPHYLPDGRILFSTTRQSQSKGILTDEGKQQFEAQDEDRNESAFVLEVYNPNGLNADGTRMHQISFNQSHDRDATVLANGRVLWSRWDHAPGKDAMHLYSANPDGTDLELYYGANSHMTGTNNTVVEFVQPRQMQDGRILALERQYTGVDFGGNLVIIDGVRSEERRVGKECRYRRARYH